MRSIVGLKCSSLGKPVWMMKRAEVQTVQTRQVCDSSDGNPFGAGGLDVTFSNRAALMDGPIATGARMSLFEMMGGAAAVATPAATTSIAASSASGAGDLDLGFGFGFAVPPSSSAGAAASGGKDCS